jgi:phage I-like protein
MASLEWREPGEGELGGLYFSPEWTAKAAAMIDAREYRYISPVFTYDPTGAVLDVLHAGLTNNPGLDGLTDLAALSAHFDCGSHDDKETPEMDLKKLLAALGLGEDKTEAEALAAVATLKAAADGAEGKIAALTAQAAQAPDPAKYVPMATHSQTQNALAALTAQVEKSDRDGLMTAALADGRILPAQDAYWRAQPVVALKAYLEVAQPVAALNGTQTGGKEPDGTTDAAALSPEQMAVCSAMNIKPEDYKASLAAA